MDVFILLRLFYIIRYNKIQNYANQCSKTKTVDCCQKRNDGKKPVALGHIHAGPWQ